MFAARAVAGECTSAPHIVYQEGNDTKLPTCQRLS